MSKRMNLNERTAMARSLVIGQPIWVKAYVEGGGQEWREARVTALSGVGTEFFRVHGAYVNGRRTSWPAREVGGKVRTSNPCAPADSTPHTLVIAMEDLPAHINSIIARLEAVVARLGA